MDTGLERDARALRIPLAAGMALSVAALVVFAWLANDVLSGEALALDRAVRDGLHARATPGWTAAMQLVTFAGSAPALLPATALAVLLLLRAGWRRAALLVAVTVAGSILLEAVLKATFERTRPQPFFGLVAPRSYSFPSGHALNSLSFYGVLALLLAARLPARAAAASLWAAAAALVAAIGISRVYLGVHHASDVLAGYAAATIWILLVAAGDHVAARRRRRAGSRGSRDG